jgi:K+-transporting ATPase A subunit
MDFVNNLNFAEIMLRYAVMIAIGIVAGVTQQWWMIVPAMMVFLMAVLGYCPIKEAFTRNKTA